MFLWQRQHFRLTRHLFLSRPSLSVTQNLLANTPVPFRRRFRVRGTWICKYANALLSRCWQPQTARRQNCPTFLQNNFIFKPSGFNRMAVWRTPCLLNAPLTFLSICTRNKKKKRNMEMIHLRSLCKVVWNDKTRPKWSDSLSLLKIEKWISVFMAFLRTHLQLHQILGASR